MFHCNEKFNVQIQPYLNKIKYVFFVSLLTESFVVGKPVTTLAPPLTLSKMGKRETGWKGGLIYTL